MYGLTYGGIGVFIRIHQYNFKKYCDLSLTQLARKNYEKKTVRLHYMKKKRKENLYYRFFKDIYFLHFQFFLTLAIIANLIFYPYLL